MQLADTLRIEPTGVPIYVQLRDQILRAMGEGVLKPGDQMPTMRQVAVALRIDLNTVRHAYDALERVGTIDLIRGRGSFVAALALGPDPVKPVDAIARQAIGLAENAGVNPVEMAERIVQLLQSGDTEQ